MQKKIIALAVAALASTAAFAQTNVTIYGVADLGEAFVKHSGSANGVSQNLVSRLDSSSSLIGFKGVEDLGNGLKAVFQFESNIAADTNVGGLNGVRDSYVGLAGGFGTVVMGNLTHPLRAMGAKVDLMPGAAGFGTTASLTGSIAGIKTGADDRAANAVAYVSPSFGGFTGTVAYINGETRTNSNSAATLTGTTYSGNQDAVNSRQYQVAAQYENGPLFVGAGYHKSKSLPLTAAAGVLDPVNALSAYNEKGQDARVYRLAAVYTLPSNTKLTALYDNTKVETGDVGATVLGFNNVKRHAFSLGVAQSFGKNTVGLQYGQALSVKMDGQKIDDSKARILTVGYQYAMSKRTMLQARYSRLTNQENVNYTFYNNPVSNGVTGSFDADYSGVMVGVRHTF